MSDAGKVKVVGPVTHGVECYEAWRNDESCPHERATVLGVCYLCRDSDPGFRFRVPAGHCHGEQVRDGSGRRVPCSCPCVSAPYVRGQR